MAEVVLSEKLLAGLAGWEVIKQARAIVAENRVVSSSWRPPLLNGVVQAGTMSFRSGLVIRRENDAENLCTCRPSREWGTICAHSVAVGIHAIRRETAPAAPGAGGQPGPASRPSPPAGARPVRNRDGRRLRRADAPAEGEALEIHVIFPPNLAEGLARGRATMFFEGRWKRGQSPLNALPMDQPFRLEEIDGRLLDAIELIAGGDTPAMVQVSEIEFASLLRHLVDHPRVTFGRSTPVQVRPEPWRVPVQARLEPSGEIVLQLAPGRKPALVAGETFWAIEGSTIRPVAVPKPYRAVFGGPVRLRRGEVPAFVSSGLPALQAATDLDANFTAADFELATRPPKFHLHLAGGMAGLTAQLQASYGARVLTPGPSSSGEELWLPDERHPRRYGTRDLPAEKAAIDRLRRSGFQGPDAQGRWTLSGQNQVLTFFAREFGRLEREWEVTLEERLERSAEKHLERIEPRFAVQPSGEQWFDLQVTFASSGGVSLPATEVQRLLRGGQNHTRLRNGKFAIIDTGAVEELEEILVDCSPEQVGGAYRISAAQAGFVHATLRDRGWEASAPQAWRQRALEQSGEVTLECPPLGPLEEVLRPYQKHGVAWLQFLRRNQFGGVLADDMGLGKTLQTLAHLAVVNRELRQRGTDSLPHLVICPTSLVSNWIEEARRFVPGLRALALHGPGREGLFPRIAESDLVVTSYALVRRDLERYRGLEFDTVVLDEAQHIKNRQTQNAQAVKAIRSRHRLVLTGTPLENSVLDLWSIFDFLMPGYLGAARDFKDRYEIPIVREKSEAAQSRLARRVRPFLLRRMKREVAPELPPRIDQVIWCELSEEQAAVYEQLLSATRREVLERSVGTESGRDRMLVLTALLRLRQVCCDLRLLGVTPASLGVADEGGPPAPDLPEIPRAEPARASSRDAAPASGKVDAFAELLEEVLDGGHRVLVFSQFTTMLGLLRERLQAADIRFSYLDGATRNRGEVVAQFQNSPDIPVFLVSLKAGGVGLNLTGADTVIHFDPWWNPAVEEQATDRAHRIGQTRVVTSYKLITRGTVEEKILNLQQRKREVLRGVLAGEEELAQSLSWEEIRELLE